MTEMFDRAVKLLGDDFDSYLPKDDRGIDIERAVRVVMAAMREPTQAMILSGYSVVNIPDSVDGMKLAYEAMIDAAISRQWDEW
jgi:hypothetical protein